MTSAQFCPVHFLAQQVQPESVNGTPDDIINRAERRAKKQLDGWADIFGKAVEGKKTAKAINKALVAASRRLPVATFRDGVDESVLHGSMLGALDSDFEIENDVTVGPERFLATNKKGFTSDPLQDATDAFLAREVVAPDTFALMTAAAKKRAFSVANLASKQMLKDTQRELARQVAVGADLRDFRRFVDARLVSAGWTPKNPSHVETIFRTNVMSAYNSGRARHQTEPIVLEVLPLWQIVTVNDGPPRQRPTHQAAHGIVLRATDPFWQDAYAPFGFNCVPYSSKVLTLEGERPIGEIDFGDIVLTGQGRWRPVEDIHVNDIADDMIVLELENGRELQLTPNHQVLTTERGWVPAGHLRESDRLVQGQELSAPPSDEATRRVCEPLLSRRTPRRTFHTLP